MPTADAATLAKPIGVGLVAPFSGASAPTDFIIFRKTFVHIILFRQTETAKLSLSSFLVKREKPPKLGGFLI